MLRLIRQAHSSLIAMGILSLGLMARAGVPNSDLSSRLGALRMRFEENRGQTDRSVRYIGRQGRWTVFFTEEGIALGAAGEQPIRMRLTKSGLTTGGRASAIAKKIDGLDPAGTSNYFIGKQSDWRTSIPNFKRVKYHEVYPGIDLVFHGNGGRIEYDFEVAPGADPSQIDMEFSGPAGLRLNADGELVIGNGVTLAKPVLYQIGESDAVHSVPGRYTIRGGRYVSFSIGRYDRNRELVIDPVLNYSAIVGSSGTDTANAVAVDSGSNAYVTGSTGSLADFPSTNGAVHATAGSETSWVFVYKLNSTGTAIAYSATIGGSTTAGAQSTGTGIAVDSSGNAFVAGTTSALDFPTTGGAFQGAPGSAGTHGFVFKLNAAGSALLYSTYLRSGGTDSIKGMTIDGSGNAYIVGQTANTFPTTAGAYQTTTAETTPAFVAKLSATGGSLVYSTFLSGSSSAASGIANAVAVDSSGNAYVTGTTTSTSFPVTGGAFQTNGNQAAQGFGFITKINVAGSGLGYSTYLSGTSVSGNGIAVDGTGFAYVTGGAGTLSVTLPQNDSTGGLFIFKLSADGTTEVFARAFGNATTAGTGIGLDPSSRPWVTGTTTVANYPVASAIQDVPGATDGVTPSSVVTQFDASSGTVLFSTYLGGPGGDLASGIAVDTNANAYVVGIAGSANFPVTSGAVGKATGDGHDTFITSLSSSSACFGSAALGNNSFSASGGSQNISVFIASGCHWLAISEVPWITMNGLQTLSGTSSGLVTYVVAANSGNARVASISVAGIAVPVSQASGCPFTLNPTGANVGAAGNPNLGVSLTTNDGCGWTITGLPTWVQVSPGTSGTNSTQLTFNVNANGGGGRSVTLTIGTQQFTINQAAGVSNPNALHFVPVTPCRIVDTRNPNGPFGGPIIAGNTSRDFAVPASNCNIPANAAAYSLNITVVPPAGLGFLQVWPTGQAQPGVSTLNSPDGRTKANAAIVPSGTNGSITVFVSNTSHVIIDINGYFISDPGNQALAYYPITPCRVADTRNPTGTFGGPALASNSPRDFPIQLSSCGVPSNAQAYSLNMTVVPPGPLSFMSVWPSGTSQPVVSTLNDGPGTVVANAAIVPAGGAGTNGGIRVIVTDATHLIIDINGYFAPPGGAGALSFFPLVPCRIMDTRNPNGPFGGPILAANTPRDISIPASSCNVPRAQAYSLNATVVPPAGLGFLQLWNTGGAQPGVSTLNASDGFITSNAAIVPAGTGGAVTTFASNSTHLILDINGYFAP